MKLKIEDNGKELIIKKIDKFTDKIYENDYAILDRSNGKSYRVKNNIKRENQDLRRFAVNIPFRSIETDSTIIQKLVDTVWRSTNLRQAGSIINELSTEKAIIVEKWLKLFDNNLEITYSTYRSFPSYGPEKLAKSIRKDIKDNNIIIGPAFINNIVKQGNSNNQIRYYNIYKRCCR